MHKSELLYEPLPIARIGVKKESEEVIVGHDYSCFANMLEEYISFGAVGICMPKSAPELSSIDQMPSLLKARIKVIDDDTEIESVRRLLYGLRKELGFETNDEDQHLKFKKDTPREIIQTVNHAHSVVKKLAIGFNHGIQIDLNPDSSGKSLRYLRGMIKDSQSRLVLAQLESLLGLYGTVDFQAPALPRDTPPLEIISIFDRLINDQIYIGYSESIAQLADPSRRKQALIQLRELERGIRTLSFISSGWDYAAKAIKAWSGIPVPESKAISSLIQGRKLPALVDMQTARASAVDMWKKSDLVHAPLGRDGSPLGEGDIVWIPPLDSMEVYSPDNKPFNLGKVGELLKALEKAKEHFQGDS